MLVVMRPPLSELHQRSRTLLLFRLVVLAAAIFLLPSTAPVRSELVPWLGASLFGLVVLWSMPLWGDFWRRPGARGTLLWIEALAVAFLIFLYGGLQSPFALLMLPLLGEAAIALAGPSYSLVAAVVLVTYALAVLPDMAGPSYPAWAPLLAIALVLLVPLLGLLGSFHRRERARGRRLSGKLRQLRLFLSRLPGFGPEPAFWRLYLDQLTKGQFASGALVRFEGGRPRVFATGREAAWDAFATRHAMLLKRQVIAEGRPELFVEELGGQRVRSIVCWPVPGRGKHDRPAGVVCLLADRVVTLAEVRRKLEGWLPIAALALATGEAHLSLARGKVDWQTLMNATLHRLQGRLSRYLVLVHVDPGVIEADAVLLGDAIAHVVEEALDRIPPRSQVRLSVRQEGQGWSFEVVTNAEVAPVTEGRAGPGVLLARQVVAAHGGEWRPTAAKQGYVLGFRLPADAQRAGGA